jgi:hypothetical protein
MNRKPRRMPHIRIRSRRTMLVAGVVVAAASVVVVAAAAFGQQGQSGPNLPPPQVDKVDLKAPDEPPAATGWEGQVGTDANLVALQWSGDQSAEYTIEVRNGNGAWKWATDTGVFDNGPDAGTKDANVGGAVPGTKNVTEPVWIGRDVTGVRVRLDSGSAQDVTLHVIDSLRGKKPDGNVEGTTDTSPPSTAQPQTSPPARSTPPGGGEGGSPSSSTSTTTTTTAPLEQGLGQGLAAAALATVAVAFIVRRRRALAVVIATAVLVGTACAPTKPPAGGAPIPDGIVTRSAWGGDLPFVCDGGPQTGSVTAAVVHHTVNNNNYGPGDSVPMIRGIYAYHVNSLGYCDIAYNFIIDNYGTPFEGRWGSEWNPIIGAHTLNYNSNTTGIAVLGTFTDVRPSDATLTTLQDLIRWKFKLHGVNPFTEDSAHIFGHRDLYPTECPGQAFYDYLPYTRYYVKAYW